MSQLSEEELDDLIGAGPAKQSICVCRGGVLLWVMENDLTLLALTLIITSAKL